MKTLELLLDLILRVLTYVDQALQSNRQEKLTKDYNDVRSDPRDLFDDGVLNNSTNKEQTDTSSVPKP